MHVKPKGYQFVSQKGSKYYFIITIIQYLSYRKIDESKCNY